MLVTRIRLNKFKKIFNSLFFFPIFLCSVFFIPSSAESREIVDRVVAVVNDEIILLSELNQALDPFAKKLGQYEYSQQQKQQLSYKLREEILNQLINERLTDQQIKKNGIEISSAEVDASIEQMKQTNRLTDEALRKALSEQGITMEEFREKIREQILRTKLVSREVKSKIVITKEDIKRFYEKEYGKYAEIKKYHLRSILMQVPSKATVQEKMTIENKMRAIHEKLEQGENFEELAKTHSHPSLAPSGGYLGAFTLETIAPKIRDTIVDLKAGEFTEILDTDQGYQIFFLDKIEVDKGKSLEEVSGEIEEKLYKEIVDEKFNTWLQELRNRSHIKIIR